MEELVEHGLQALRETLQQDKELTIHNTSLGIIGPVGADETNVASDGSFRILEEEKVDPYIKRLQPKESAVAAAAATGDQPPPAAPGAAPTGDEDVQMAE